MDDRLRRIGTENLSLYTKVDPSGFLDIEANNILNFVNFDRNGDTYLYRDFGPDFFRDTWNMWFEILISAIVPPPFIVIGMLSNIVDDWKGIDDALGDCIGFSFGSAAGDPDPYVREVYGGVAGAAAGTSLSQNTTYYVKVERRAIGTYGQIGTYIYTDRGMGTRVSYAEWSLHKKQYHRYLSIVNSYNDGNVDCLSGTITNFKVQTF